MAKKRKKTRKKTGQPMTLAAATEAVGSAVGRAVGRVEQMMSLARERMAAKTTSVSKPSATKRPRKTSR